MINQINIAEKQGVFIEKSVFVQFAEKRVCLEKKDSVLNAEKKHMLEEILIPKSKENGITVGLEVGRKACITKGQKMVYALDAEKEKLTVEEKNAVPVGKKKTKEGENIQQTQKKNVI